MTGKALAISSPALLAAALTGGGMLWSMRARIAWRASLGALVVAALAGGVLWSNALAYHDVTLAPRARLAELQHIGKLVAGKGPTFVNEYEVYADRHFLREGAPVEPAEYRPVTLPLRNGVTLTKAAWADLDSFPLSTLEPYRSIVTARSPAESRPPSIYRLVWQGRYYQLWQRPAQPHDQHPRARPAGRIEHAALLRRGGGRSRVSRCARSTPWRSPPARWCAASAAGRSRARATASPTSAPRRSSPAATRRCGPAAWVHESRSAHAHPQDPGRRGHAISPLAVSQRYELWLGGSFARGFEVSVDGRQVGTVSDELSAFRGYVHVADLPCKPASTRLRSPIRTPTSPPAAARTNSPR